MEKSSCQGSWIAFLMYLVRCITKIKVDPRIYSYWNNSRMPYRLSEQMFQKYLRQATTENLLWEDSGYLYICIESDEGTVKGSISIMEIGYKNTFLTFYKKYYNPNAPNQWGWEEYAKEHGIPVGYDRFIDNWQRRAESNGGKAVAEQVELTEKDYNLYGNKFLPFLADLENAEITKNELKKRWKKKNFTKFLQLSKDLYLLTEKEDMVYIDQIAVEEKKDDLRRGMKNASVKDILQTGTIPSDAVFERINKYFAKSDSNSELRKIFCDLSQKTEIKLQEDKKQIAQFNKRLSELQSEKSELVTKDKNTQVDKNLAESLREYEDLKEKALKLRGTITGIRLCSEITNGICESLKALLSSEEAWSKTEKLSTDINLASENNLCDKKQAMSLLRTGTDLNKLCDEIVQINAQVRESVRRADLDLFRDSVEDLKGRKKQADSLFNKIQEMFNEIEQEVIDSWVIEHTGDSVPREIIRTHDMRIFAYGNDETRENLYIDPLSLKEFTCKRPSDDYDFVYYYNEKDEVVYKHQAKNTIETGVSLEFDYTGFSDFDTDPDNEEFDQTETAESVSDEHELDDEFVRPARVFAPQPENESWLLEGDTEVAETTEVIAPTITEPEEADPDETSDVVLPIVAQITEDRPEQKNVEDTPVQEQRPVDLTPEGNPVTKLVVTATVVALIVFSILYSMWKNDQGESTKVETEDTTKVSTEPELLADTSTFPEGTRLVGEEEWNALLARLEDRPSDTVVIESKQFLYETTYVVTSETVRVETLVLVDLTPEARAADTQVIVMKEVVYETTHFVTNDTVRVEVPVATSVDLATLEDRLAELETKLESHAHDAPAVPTIETTPPLDTTDIVVDLPAEEEALPWNKAVPNGTILIDGNYLQNSVGSCRVKYAELNADGLLTIYVEASDERDIPFLAQIHYIKCDSLDENQINLVEVGYHSNYYGDASLIVVIEGKNAKCVWDRILDVRIATVSP